MTETDTSTSQGVNPANNQLTGLCLPNQGACYDANGNQLYMPYGGPSENVALSYDIENRLVQVGGPGGNGMSGVIGQYAYNHLNQRVWRLGTENGTPSEQIYFYGVDGQRLASYALAAGLPTESDGYLATLTATASDVQIYFGHKLVQRGEHSSTAQGKMPVGFIGQDMVGSVRADDLNAAWSNFYPWGAEQGTVTPNDRVKFATYTRDGETGIDYAMNRYYNSLTGRFLTVDPFNGSGNPSNPVSWNPYAYMNDSPVNGNDPRGLIAGIPGGPGGPGFGGPNDTGCEDLSTWMENFFDFGVNPMGGLYGDLNCSLFPFYFPFTPGIRQFAPPAQPPYKQLSQTQETQMLNAAVSLADKALSNTDCAGLFKGPNPTALLASLVSGGMYGTLGYGRIGNQSVAATATLPSGTVGVTITINDNANGLWGFEGGLQNAGTLLHELGHVYTDLWGAGASLIQPDVNANGTVNANAEDKNNGLIDADCLKGLQ